MEDEAGKRSFVTKAPNIRNVVSFPLQKPPSYGRTGDSRCPDLEMTMLYMYLPYFQSVGPGGSKKDDVEMNLYLQVVITDIIMLAGLFLHFIQP